MVRILVDPTATNGFETLGTDSTNNIFLADDTTTDVSWWEPFPNGTINDRQKVFIVEYVCLFVGSIILWRSKVLLPMKLFSVFLHELGHAMMAWACCGSVTGIEVHSDQGGLTHFNGVGNYAIFWILPAGYLGSAVWACTIVIMSGGDATAVAIALVLCVFLGISLVYSFLGDKERFGWALPLICIFNMAVLIPLSIWCITGEYSLRYRILEAWLIFLGGITTVNASWDIVEDTISRKVDRSDASRFAKIVPCCGSRCVGVIWFMMSVTCVGVSMYFALLMRKPVPNTAEPTYWNNIMYGVSGGYVGFALAERLLVKYFLKGKN